MTTPTKVHCFFEQSGTFKNEFRKIGIPAEDYDIQNNFGETDHVIDLFAEIEKGYDGKPSVFDSIGNDDLIMAFFPCIYFTGSVNPCYFTLENENYKCLSTKQKFDVMIDRAEKRNEFYKKLYRLVGICIVRGFRLIIENPYSSLHFLHNNFLKEPSIIDYDRRRRGDYFKKPTGYWFFGAEPTKGSTFSKAEKTMTIWGSGLKKAEHAGLCSEERSMISHDYARNFIADFILGKPLGGRPQQQDLFAQTEGETKCL